MRSRTASRFVGGWTNPSPHPAGAIVMTTGEAVRRIRAAFPELAGKPIVSIPCGFDRNDFAGPSPSRADEAFRIVHTGYLHTELGRQQRRQALARALLGGGWH